jgi:hypothetical protein
LPQREREERDENSSERSQRPVVPFYKGSRTANMSVDYDAESGWIFFGGGIGLGFLLLGYTLLKRWHKSAFGQDKADHNQNKKD